MASASENPHASTPPASGAGEIQFPCSRCGAKLVFRPGTSLLVCEHCGGENAIPETEAAIRELDYRYTTGLLIGRDIFDDATRFLTAFAGVGYSDEEIGGITESGAVAFWRLRYEHALWDGVDFFHRQDFTQQFYGEENLILKTTTGFKFDIIDDLYTNISYRYDYETEPAEGASKDDSTLQVGIGYEF